jgi:peroxiredoxin
MKAPTFTLPSSLGGKISLSDYAGKKNVLLYFQEGVMCSPCWNQLEDIQKNYDKFKSLDVEVLTILVDPLNADIKESNKRGINLPLLDDGNLSASKAYNVLDYSMHPGSRPGHTFVLIGKDSNIIWKKDYYQSVEEGGMVMNGMNMNMAGRMYVPVDELLREIYKVSYLLYPESTSKSSSLSPSDSNTTSPQSTNTNDSNYGPQKQLDKKVTVASGSNNTITMVDHSMCFTPIHRHADLKIYLNGNLLNLSERKYMDQSSEVHFHPTVKVKPNDIPGIPFGDMVHIHKDNVTIGDFLNTLDLDNVTIKALHDIKTSKVYVNSNALPKGLDYIMHDKDRILVSNTPSGNPDEIAKQMQFVTSYGIIGEEKNPSLFGGC